MGLYFGWWAHFVSLVTVMVMAIPCDADVDVYYILPFLALSHDTHLFSLLSTSLNYIISI